MRCLTLLSMNENPGTQRNFKWTFFSLETEYEGPLGIQKNLL